ncbi:MAG: hypothetical protein AB7G68_03195 [Nitrospiraceae bacterium]
MPDEAIANALKLFELTPPVTREQLDRTRDQLLHTWNPHRFANLTNNPKRYMQMVKKGEAMTKEVEAAYSALVNWLKDQST